MEKDSSGEKSSRRQFISADPNKCIGCSICEYACALEKEGSFNPLRSRIRVMRLHPWVNIAVACRFCEDAPCVKACPRDALVQSEEDGVILIDEKKCDACGWCIPACPYGVILLHPEKKVVIACDLCEGEPKCIDFCPEDALELVTSDADAQKTLLSAINELKSEVDRLAKLIKSGLVGDLFLDADKKLENLEEKLKALTKKEQEMYQKST